MQRLRMFLNYVWLVLLSVIFLTIPSVVLSQNNYFDEDDIEFAEFVEELGDEYNDYESDGDEAALSLMFSYPLIEGPEVCKLSNRGELFVPEGYSFLGEQRTMLMMTMMGNEISGKEVGLISSNDENAEWYAVFEFDEVGYIKAEDAEELDAEMLLKWIQENTYTRSTDQEDGSWSYVRFNSWAAEPTYNPDTKMLEWASVLETDGNKFVNHNIRILGRQGVMSVTIAVTTDQFSSVRVEINRILESFKFLPGNRYSEFVEGENVAYYDLVGLAAGGHIVESDSGSSLWIWRILLIGFAVIGTIFTFLFKGKTEETAEQGQEKVQEQV